MLFTVEGGACLEITLTRLAFEFARRACLFGSAIIPEFTKHTPQKNDSAPLEQPPKIGNGRTTVHLMTTSETCLNKCEEIMWPADSSDWPQSWPAGKTRARPRDLAGAAA